MDELHVPVIWFASSKDCQTSLTLIGVKPLVAFAKIFDASSEEMDKKFCSSKQHLGLMISKKLSSNPVSRMSTSNSIVLLLGELQVTKRALSWFDPILVRL